MKIEQMDHSRYKNEYILNIFHHYHYVQALCYTTPR